MCGGTVGRIAKDLSSGTTGKLLAPLDPLATSMNKAMALDQWGNPFSGGKTSWDVLGGTGISNVTQPLGMKSIEDTRGGRTIGRGVGTAIGAGALGGMLAGGGGGSAAPVGGASEDFATPEMLQGGQTALAGGAGATGAVGGTTEDFATPQMIQGGQQATQGINTAPAGAPASNIQGSGETQPGQSTGQVPTPPQQGTALKPQTQQALGTSPTGQAGGAANQQSFVQNVLQQMKANAVPLGVSGLALAAGARQKPMPNQQQYAGLSQEAQQTAEQALQAYRSGQLPAAQQAQLDQQTQQAKTQIRNYFASIGQFDSTARIQAEQQIDQQAQAMKGSMLNQLMQGGLSAIGVASGPLNTMTQYQVGQDQQLQNAMNQFAQQVGNLYGRQAGQPVAAAKPTAPTPVDTTQAAQQAAG